MNDRVSDLTRRSGPHHNRSVGRNVVSAEVIRFIASPSRDARTPTDFPTIAFRAAVQSDELAAANADTAPSEIVPFDCDEA
jgi:hypothetical protein